MDYGHIDTCINDNCNTMRLSWNKHQDHDTRNSVLIFFLVNISS